MLEYVFTDPTSLEQLLQMSKHVSVVFVGADAELANNYERCLHSQKSGPVQTLTQDSVISQNSTKQHVYWSFRRDCQCGDKM